MGKGKFGSHQCFQRRISKWILYKWGRGNSRSSSSSRSRGRRSSRSNKKQKKQLPTSRGRGGTRFGSLLLLPRRAMFATAARIAFAFARSLFFDWPFYSSSSRRQNAQIIPIFHGFKKYADLSLHENSVCQHWERLHARKGRGGDVRVRKRRCPCTSSLLRGASLLLRLQPMMGGEHGVESAPPAPPALSPARWHQLSLSAFCPRMPLTSASTHVAEARVFGPKKAYENELQLGARNESTKSLRELSLSAGQRARWHLQVHVCGVVLLRIVLRRRWWRRVSI